MLDLFSGIGGFSYAAQQVWGKDLDIIAFCENDPFCQEILNKHWPGIPIIEDIRGINEKISPNTAGCYDDNGGNKRSDRQRWN